MLNSFGHLAIPSDIPRVVCSFIYASPLCLNTYTLVTRRAPTGHPAGWPSDETPAGAPAGETR